MKTSRRTFLATLLAAIAGRALVRKPKPHVGVDLAAGEDRGISIRMIRQWDRDLGRFTVRMDCLWGLQAQHNAWLSSECEVRFIGRDGHSFHPAPIEFDPHFGVDFEFAEDDHLLRIGAPLSVPRPRREAA